jgi:FHS family L-fucose permease-like MFS transporter
MPLQPLSPTTKAATTSSTHSLFPAGQLVPFVLVTFLFFLWGIPNNLNDVLIRQFMKSFELTRFQAGLVQSAFYMGYFLLAIPASLLMKRAGYQAGFVTGLVLLGAGAFLFWPAALVGSYGFFLFALFVMASGLSFLETASNPFIAQLGDPDSSERRLNFSQAFNPLGAMSAALIGTVFIFSGVELSKNEVSAQIASHSYEAYLRFETLRVVRPYIVIGIVALLWAVLIWRTKFPDIPSEKEPGGDHGNFSHRGDRPILLRRSPGRHLELLYFLRKGILQSHRKSRRPLFGGHSGRLRRRPFRLCLSHAIRVSQQTHGRLCRHQHSTSVGCCFPSGMGRNLVPLAHQSLMFPTIFALGLKGLGPNTKIGGSLLVMAIIGGAVLTPIMGLISEKLHSIALSYSVPLVAYVVIVLYSFWGSRQRNETT